MSRVMMIILGKFKLKLKLANNHKRDELQVVESEPLEVTVHEQYCVSGINGIANTFRLLIEYKSGTGVLSLSQ